MLELNRIHHTSALDLLQQIVDAALIIADPPYGIGYKSGQKTRLPRRNDRKAKLNKTERIAPAEFGADKFDPTWLKPAYNALADNGAMYLFTRWDVLHLWKHAAEKAGFKVVQRIVWDKALWGAGNLDYYGSQTEDILFCVKGKPEMQWDGREGNVWRIGRGRVTGKDGGGRHCNQKPVDLFTRIIAYSSRPGDLIVDPFAGSGASLIAAQRLHRKFIASEIVQEFASQGNNWLAENMLRHPETNMIPMFG